MILRRIFVALLYLTALLSCVSEWPSLPKREFPPTPNANAPVRYTRRPCEEERREPSR